MIAGLSAFAVAAGFSGAALYIGLVEQPSRLALDDRALASQWKLSDRRGLLMLGVLALISAIFGLAAYFQSKDASWLVGSAIILGAWPYMFYVMVPLNNDLLSTEPTASQRSASRQLILDWGLLEWGLVANGLIATLIFGRPLA
jgi:predicted acyltransferase